MAFPGPLLAHTFHHLDSTLLDDWEKAWGDIHPANGPELRDRER